MNNINPALASAVQSIYMQANGLSDNTAKEPKVQEKTSVSSSAANNTTVTLSSKAGNIQPDYTDLAVNKVVSNRDSVENSNVAQSELTNGTTYASNLQAQSNFYRANGSVEAEIK